MKVYVGHSLRRLGPTGHSYLQDPENGRDQEVTKQCKLWRQDGEGKVGDSRIDNVLNHVVGGIALLTERSVSCGVKRRPVHSEGSVIPNY